jgi:hypothetical protein
MISSRESNIDLSEKRISQHLQDLIDAANNSVGTLKEQILEIYYQAVKEGFTPHQAKLLIKERVLAKAAPSYIYKVLPEESKRTYISQENKENSENISSSIQRDILKDSQETNQNIENITDSSYQGQKAESIGEEFKGVSESEQQQLPPKEDDQRNSEDQILVTYEIQKLRTELKEARQIIDQQAEKIDQLAIKQVKTFGHKFTFEFDFEAPNGIIFPVLVTVFPDKQTGWVIFDKKRGANL